MQTEFAKHIPWLSVCNFKYILNHNWEMPNSWEWYGLSIPYVYFYQYTLDPKYSYISLMEGIIAHTMVALVLEAFRKSVGHPPISYEADQTGRLKYFDMLSIAEKRWGNIGTFVDPVKSMIMDEMTKRFGLTKDHNAYKALAIASMKG